eukprot:GFUD01036191.1.p1 GENE.GFUD01036191.1~~GFUD01036191.1.p1  ORF type:complete len:416 (-),score=134.68 GFUD01036191.1:26-1273(-)
MALSESPSSVVQSGPLRNQQEVIVIMNDMDILLKANEVLDIEVDVLMKKKKEMEKEVDLLMKRKKENSAKISELVGKVKRIGGNDIEAMDGQLGSDEEPEMESENHAEDMDDRQEGSDYDAKAMDQEGSDKIGKTDEEIIKSLKEKESFILRKIEESTRNLMDQEDELKSLEMEGGCNQSWHTQFQDVLKYRAMHQMFKDSQKLKLKEIQDKLKRIESQSGTGTSRGSWGKEKGSKKKFVIQAASPNNEAGPSNSKSSFASNRRLNESVVDCVFKPKKISSRERNAMTTIAIKVEEDSPPNQFVCNICPKSFTCAAPLVIHIQKHYPEAQEKLDCPFSTCGVSANKVNLIKHLRSKHTKEQLFLCSFCPTKFPTMPAKLYHEKKHTQPTVWAQCGKAACLRFYQVVKGCCRCSKM